jgi:hypothetical protein
MASSAPDQISHQHLSGADVPISRLNGPQRRPSGHGSSVEEFLDSPSSSTT